MAEYKLLEPDIAPAFGVTAPTFTGTPTLFASSSFIFALSITIVIVAASFRYAYAGVLRLPASEEGIRKSKEEFKRVTYGLLGVLGLWLVLFTVNKDMLTGEVTLSALKSSGGGGGAGALTQTVPTTVPIVTNPPVTTPPGTSASEKANRDILLAAGVGINHEPCPTPSSTGCTDVGGLQSNIMNAVLALKAQCKCDVMITGGSEKAGHSSTSNHPSGRAVDISLTPNLVSFFSNPANGVVNVGDNSKCNTKYSFSGLIFWDEAQGCDSVGGARHYHASVSGK
jgi:hypothetical protein